MSNNRVTDESYVTLATNENYALGALTLGKSLRSVNTNRKLTCMITSEVPSVLVDHLRSVFDLVEVVDVLNSDDDVNLALLKRPELGVTFTKLHCWRLTQFKKAVFLDADCLVLKNIDDLFDREELSAATDIGWPDCFNSGVFVFRPSLETYSRLLAFAVSTGSFDGGDQGLLNAFFSGWSTAESSRRLPFVYNMTTNASYSYAPAYKQFKESIKVVHFIGAQKPWYYSYNLDTQTVTGNVTVNEVEHLNQWWTLFVSDVLPSLNNETRFKLSTQLIQKDPNSITFTQLQLGSQGQQGEIHHHSGNSGASGSGGIVIGSDLHKNLFEHGQIEVQGRDSFSNIQAHLDEQIKK